MSDPGRSRAGLIVLALAAWIGFGAFLLNRTLDRDLNHDEHQFLVPGALLSREGLLPYRDYPLFHLPNLVFAYAAADRLTGDLILGAKLVCFAATMIAAGAILVAFLRGFSGKVRLGGALLACLLLLLLFDPVFLYTAGKTWNHEVPACLLVLAVLFHVESARRDSTSLIALSGLAAGLAVGTRLTFLPTLLPLLGAIFWFPVEKGRRWVLAGAFGAAAAVSFLPSIYFLATTPEAFLFGNLEFPRLRLLDPENTRIRKTMTVWRKARYFAKEILLPSWPLFAAFFGSLWAARRWRCTSSQPGARRLVALVTAALVVGCFLPSRYQYQHFFGIIPLLVLGVAYAVADLASQRTARDLPALCLAVAAIASASLAVRHARRDGEPLFLPLAHLADSREWFSTRAREVGGDIARRVPPGPVLTLAPAWVLAGGRTVYPEFATGPFAWRSARFVAEDRRPALKVIAPADLDHLLAARPPVAILTGVEDEPLEQPLVAAAQARGFRPEKMGKKRVLWVPTAAAPATPAPAPRATDPTPPQASPSPR